METRDPVCRRVIDLADVEAYEDHDGWAYFFCSKECQQKFRARPARYATKPRSGFASLP
jgi:Cu+-exporting ATPase